MQHAYFENPGSALFDTMRYGDPKRSSLYDATGAVTGVESPTTLLFPRWEGTRYFFPDVFIEPGRGGLMAPPASFRPPKCTFKSNFARWACTDFHAAWMELLVYQMDGSHVPATQPIGNIDTYWAEHGDPRSTNNLKYFGFAYEFTDNRKRNHLYSHRRPLLAYRHYHLFFDKNQPVLPPMRIRIWDALTKDEVYWLTWHKLDTTRVPVVEYNHIRPTTTSQQAVQEASLDKLIASSAQVGYAVVGDMLIMKIHAIYDRPGLLPPSSYAKNVEVRFKYANKDT